MSSPPPSSPVHDSPTNSGIAVNVELNLVFPLDYDVATILDYHEFCFTNDDSKSTTESRDDLRELIDRVVSDRSALRHMRDQCLEIQAWAIRSGEITKNMIESLSEYADYWVKHAFNDETRPKGKKKEICQLFLNERALRNNQAQDFLGQCDVLGDRLDVLWSKCITRLAMYTSEIENALRVDSELRLQRERTPRKSHPQASASKKLASVSKLKSRRRAARVVLHVG